MNTKTNSENLDPQGELPFTEGGSEGLPPEGEGEDIWGTLGEEFDADNFEEEGVGQEPPQGQEKVEGKDTPEGTEEPEEKVVPEVVQEKAPTPEVETPKEEVKPKPAEKEQPAQPTQESLLARRKQLEEELAKTYAIDPDDVDALRLSPEEVLPKLAARVTVDTYERVLETLVSQLPSFVQHVMESNSQQRSLEEEFYSANPGLAEYAKTNGREQVDQLAAQIAVMLRAQNPGISKEELIVKVGRSAETMLGLQSRVPQEGVPPQPGTEETVVEEVVSRPFVPARGVSAAQQQQRAKPTNPFESLNELWDNDEFGDE